MGLKTFLAGAAIATAISVAPAFAEDLVFMLDNQSSGAIKEFYASPVGVVDWEEDILGDDVLANNASIVMNIDDGTGACMFDFKAEFTNGQNLIRNNVNVCEIADYYYTR